MEQIPLTTTPNQSISFNTDGAYWQLHLYTSISYVCIDIVRNGENVIQGARCFAGVPLIPFLYLQGGFGNFRFNEDADWNNFQTSCILYYLTYAEDQSYQSTIKSELIDYGNSFTSNE